MKVRVAEKVVELSTTPFLVAVSRLTEIHRKCPVVCSSKSDSKVEDNNGFAVPSLR